MTKAEELKVLEKIDALIKSAGDDSYIAMTFKGIVDIARNNIENDFGDAPVDDLAAARKHFSDMEKIAQSISAERDAIKEDFDELAAAYRYAVQTIQTASYYVHCERTRLRDAVDALPENSGDEEIADAFRQHKKAQTVAQRCSEVLDASLRKPLCFAMKG